DHFADRFAEPRVNVCDRSGPAAELEAAGGVFFRPARGLHHAIHRDHRADDHFSHGNVSYREPKPGLDTSPRITSVPVLIRAIPRSPLVSIWRVASGSRELLPRTR